MTGSQPNPASGKNALGEEAPKLNLVELCQAVGVKMVEVVDTWQRKEIVLLIRKALAYDGPAVVIAQGPCQQLPEMKWRHNIPYVVEEVLCTQCEACFKVWCPAIKRTETGYPFIVSNECTSCTVCAQVCPTNAIHLMDTVIEHIEVV
jgi:indolepyruvate ferredoxin oxidoreductase alpha subunit